MLARGKHYWHVSLLLTWLSLMVVQDLLKYATRNGLIPEFNAVFSISVRMYDRVLLGIQ